MRRDPGRVRGLPATGHTETELPAVAPTCAQSGLTKGSKCAACGEILLAQDLVPSLEHTIVILEEQAPACAETGLTQGAQCSVCQKVLVAQTIVPATGHSPKILPTTPPTCENTGLSQGSACSVCDEILIAQTVIPETGHTVIVQSAKEATCSEAGVTEGRYCIICNTTFAAQQVIPATGKHVIVIDPAVAPTCKQIGYTEGSHCAQCGEVQKAQEILAQTAHSSVILQAKDSTCTETGLTEGSYCAECGDTLVAQQIVGMKEHTPSTQSYSETDYCLEHRVGYVICTVCNTELYNFGHSYVKTITQPTCQTDGAYVYTCAHCKSSYSEPIPATGHIAYEWTTVKYASCTEEGELQMLCENCGECTASSVIEKTAHSYCSSAEHGIITYTCTKCADSYAVTTQVYLTVTLESNGGTALEPVHFEKGSSYDLPTPSKENWIFAGWFFDEELKNSCLDTASLGADTKLYAGWYPDALTENIDSKNIITDAPLNFTFKVQTDLALTDETLENCVSVRDTHSNAVQVYIYSVSENIYTIAASADYASGMNYSVTLAEGVRFPDASGNELWFVTEERNHQNIDFKDGVILLCETDIYSILEATTENDEDALCMFLRSDMLSVGDQVVIYGESRDDILCIVRVVAEGSSENTYYYQVEAADPENVFDNYEVHYSGDLDVTDIEFEQDLEQLLTEQIMETKLYAQFEYAAMTFAQTAAYEDYYYKYTGIQVKPKFSAKDSKITIVFDISAGFERTDRGSGKVTDHFKVILNISNVLKFDVTANVHSANNFVFVVDTQNTLKINLYTSLGTKESASEKAELNYFKKLFEKARSEGRFNELDSSNASSSKETQLGVISFPLYGIRFNIELSTVMSFEAVGELGVSVQMDYTVSVGVKRTPSTGFQTIKSFKSHSSISFYMMGKIEASSSIKLSMSASVLGIINAHVDLEAGPYFEMGGMCVISVSDGGGVGGTINGYLETGIKIKASAGVNAKIQIKIFRWKKTVTLFEKTWTLYDQKFALLSFGTKEAVLYFTDVEEELSHTYTCGSQVNVATLISKQAVVQDLTEMSKSLEDAKECLYYLDGSYAGISLTTNGMLTITECGAESTDVRIKVVSGDIYKYANITLTPEHSKQTIYGKLATCTTDGYTDYIICTICNNELTEKTILPAGGHSEVVHAAQAPTCVGYGWEEYISCTNCGYSTFEKIPASGHVIEIDPAVPATCTQNGLTQGEHCSACQTVLVAQRTIPYLGHKAITLRGFAATCTENGLTDGAQCTVCGKIIKQQEIIPAHGHEFQGGKCIHCQIGALITLSGADAQPGDTIRIDVYLANNPGISFLSLTPQYDETVLTLVSATAADLGFDLDQGTNLILSADQDQTGDGTLLTLIFRVSSDANQGSYEVSLIFREGYNGALEEIVPFIESAVINVTAPAEPTITLSGVHALPGETVEIQVYLENNPGISYLSLTPWCENGLTFLSAQAGELGFDLDQGVNLIFSADEARSENGLLVTLTFLVAEDVAEGEYEITLLLRECYDDNLEDVAPIIGRANVSISFWG